MGWTRSPGRFARDRRRPGIEGLEDRQLLSMMGAEPAPAAAVRNLDGSTNFDQIIGASATRSAFGVDGSGSNVAVIDTGVNYQNPTLGGALGPGNKVVAGVDFTGSPNGVLPTWQHGTGVAGILAANTPGYQGVAPGSGIVALRVFGDGNQGSFGNIEKALEWVVQHHTEYHITAVNLSISDGGNYQANDFGQDGGVGQAITGSVKLLDSMDIPVVVATGNSFNGKTPGEGFPSTIPDTISVTATDASDKLASNAQRLGPSGGSSATTIAAPGVGILGPADGSRMTLGDGTSFATPQVTGSIVLLQQIFEKAFHKLPTVAQLEGFLQQGAVTIHDDLTNSNIGRLNVLGSAKILAQQIATVQKATANSNVVTAAQTLADAPAVRPSTPTPVTPSPETAPVSSVPTPPAQAPPAQPPPVQAPAAPPQTEVFYNGLSIGTFSTTQLSVRYSNLFSFLKGPVGSIRVYGPKGSVPDLGASKPSGTSGGKPVVAHPKPAPQVQAAVHANAIPAPAPKSAVKKPAAHKKHSSFFESLFPFKF